MDKTDYQFSALIIEDETPAADRLELLIKQVSDEITVLGPIDSVEDAVDWFSNNPAPDLIFMDIQLADGISFEIFESINIESPIIFTTAYDQYAVKAFKVNSIDYLLKPIDPEEFNTAIKKFQKTQSSVPSFDPTVLLKALQQPAYKDRFLIKIGEQYRPFKTSEIAYFYAEEGLVFLTPIGGRTIPVDYTLDQLEGLIDPARFFRLNRKFIASAEAITKIHTHPNSRLRLELNPKVTSEVIISRDRVSVFKKWMN